MSNSSFIETQRFRQVWIWIILIGITASFGWGVVQQLILGKPWGDRPAPDILLVILFLLMAVMLLFFYCIKLETEINETGIYYRFFPFQISPQKIEWSAINSATVIKYHPLREYGGWGIRYSFGNKKAYSISGNQGLQLELKSGQRLLIGTQQPAAISLLLQQLFDKKTIN